MGVLLNPPNQPPTSNVRYGVLGFACSLSLLTYLDRICISRAKEDIARDLALSDVQMGVIFSAFLLGYGILEVPGGRMGDRWGARRVLTVIVLWWSLFTALTGCIWPFSLDSGLRISGSLSGLEWDVPLLLDAFLLLVLVRFIFGLGEAGAYPNLARLAGVWFPFRERAVALGAIWMFARIGGAISAMLIGFLTAQLGWRPAFWIFGLLGVLWCAVFWRFFHDTPEVDPRVSPTELAEIRSGPYSFQASQAAAAHGKIPWRSLVRSVNMWALCVASCGVSFAWYFYPTWQPQFLKDEFQISFADSEILTGLPFACGAVGCLLGGRLSDWMIGRTGSRRWGRSLIGIVGFTGAGVCVLATGYVTEAWQAVVLLCLAFFINDIAIPPIWAVCTDIGGRHAGSLSGVVNTAGAVGGFLSPILAPALRQMNYPWATVFAVLAAAWFIAAAAWLLIDASKPIPADSD